MGFELEEVTPAEEYPYSFKDYLLQPAILSSRIFSAIILSPKLKYWLLTISISSIFLTIGSWALMSKLVINIRLSDEFPQGAQEMIGSLIELTIRNPLVIFINSLIGEFIESLISALVIFILARSFSDRGSFSSGIMVAGLGGLPSIVYGMLLTLLGFSMPEVEWNIEIGPQAGTFGFEENIPWEIFLQESILQLIISIWFFMVLLVCFTRGYGMTRGKAAVTSLCTCLASNIFLILGLVMYI
ncbi:MAG: YIP1 family protein [Candidatus Korarchaeum sp.]|nr:YIP1 family protein [Candidatus Korarchaeum sp.]MDW8035535.1 YIP1 family protein [Candidatus Korarchaeum sp.]